MVNSSLSRRTLGNATILTAGAAAESVLQFLFLVMAGRSLGPEEFGFYGYLLSLVTFAVTAAQFGLPAMSVREMAQRPSEERALFAATFRIRAVLALLFMVIAFIVSLIAPLTPVHRSAVWLMFAYLLFLPFDLSFLFDARKMSRWDVPGKLSGRIVSVGLLALLWWLRHGALTVADVALCGSLLMLVNVAIGWWTASRLGLPLHPFSRTGETVRLARISLPLLWSNMMMTTYSQSLTILVKALSTALETGFYALANRLLLPVLIVKGILYRLFLPIVSEVGMDRQALTQRVERILLALALIFMPAVAIAIPAAEVIIVPLFGPQYAGAVLPFQIGVSLLFFTGMGSMFGTALLGAGDARTSTTGLTIGTALSVGLCFLLIPAQGALGATWAAWIGELVAVLYTLPNFLKLCRPHILIRLLKLAAASASGTAAYYVLKEVFAAPGLLSLGAACLVLLAGLSIVGEISSARLQTLRSLFRKSSTAPVPAEEPADL